MAEENLLGLAVGVSVGVAVENLLGPEVGVDVDLAVVGSELGLRVVGWYGDVF